MCSISPHITTMENSTVNRSWCLSHRYCTISADNLVFCRYNISQNCYQTSTNQDNASLGVKRNTQLSALDMAYMAINYPSSSQDRQSLQLQIALRALKIPSEVSKDWTGTNVRNEFAKYALERKSEYIIILIMLRNNASHLETMVSVFVSSLASAWTRSSSQRSKPDILITRTSFRRYEDIQNIYEGKSMRRNCTDTDYWPSTDKFAGFHI